MTKNFWNTVDLKKLRKLAEEGLTWEEIGTQLGRSASACQSRWYRITYQERRFAAAIEATYLRWVRPKYASAIDVIRDTENKYTDVERSEASRVYANILLPPDRNPLFKEWVKECLDELKGQKPHE